MISQLLIYPFTEEAVFWDPSFTRSLLLQLAPAQDVELYVLPAPSTAIKGDRSSLQCLVKNREKIASRTYFTGTFNSHEI